MLAPFQALKAASTLLHTQIFAQFDPGDFPPSEAGGQKGGLYPGLEKRCQSFPNVNKPRRRW